MDLADFDIGIGAILAPKRSSVRGRFLLSDDRCVLHTSSAGDVRFSLYSDGAAADVSKRAGIRRFLRLRSGKAIDRHPSMTGRILSRVLVVVGLVAGQGPGLVPEATAQEDSGATFRAGVEAVSVSAAVRDSRGRVVQTLKKEDFEVLEIGRAHV